MQGKDISKPSSPIPGETTGQLPSQGRFKNGKYPLKVTIKRCKEPERKKFNL
jgi:hypothetical protein